jgi:aromatic-L-amino-acid decarboxylase
VSGTVSEGSERVEPVDTAAASRRDEGAPHLDLEAFRELGRRVIDWLAEYHRNVGSLPVLSQVEPHAIYDALPAAAPRAGEPFDAVLADLDRLILPGLTHWQSPNFFAFFPANASGPAILGELLSAGLGVQGMLWATSPACTELEMRVLDWLVDLLGLPEAFRCTSTGGGVIQDTASSATLCALVAARERATGGRTNETGVDGPMHVYGSSQSHCSLEKSVGLAGLGRRHLRQVDGPDGLTMDAGALARAIVEDRRAGGTPVMACATIGTTGTGAIDPVAGLGPVCREHGVWLHVDGAMSGTAALCPEFRHLHDGLELADSYCFNPHKWMLTNFDCDCFWVRDRSALIDAMSITPEYLRNPPSESGQVFDYRDWHVPLGRRFRALKLWMVIRHYGLEGLQRHVRYHVELARWFADQVRDSDQYGLACEPPLNLVCFHHVAGDEATRAVMDRLNRSGRLYLTHTTMHDRVVMRFCSGATHTRREHVEQAWDAIREAGEDF